MAKRRHKTITSQYRLPAQNVSKIYSQRRPFWLPALSYYFLSMAIASIVFFLTWGILIEGGEETPWITAGVISSLILIGSVFLREVFLRNARRRFLLAQQQLDFNLSKIPRTAKRQRRRPKFTLQQNSLMLNQIKEKSDAARVLKRLPEVHFEVFEICNEYLNFTFKELKWIDKNSPRFLAVKKGRRKVKKAHQYHLLKWAEVETRKFTNEAKSCATVVGKVELAQKALAILDSALKFYQNDANLIESHEAISEFITSIKITSLIEKAEQSVFQANYQDAIGQYNDILFMLTRENIRIRDKLILTEKVQSEINKLSRFEDVRNSIVYQPDRLNEIKND